MIPHTTITIIYMAVKRIGKTELRYREGKGTRFLQDGVTVRCQGVPRTYLEEKRLTLLNEEEKEVYLDLNNRRIDKEQELSSEERAEWEIFRERMKVITSDDIWPHHQCRHAAEPGAFACRRHGGASKNIKRSITFGISHALPVEMQDMYDRFRADPDLASRYHEMAMLQVRNAQLMGMLEEYGYGPETVEEIARALNVIRAGLKRKDLAEGHTIISQAADRIENAIQSSHGQKEVWDEWRGNAELSRKLQDTQHKSENILRQFVSREQLSSTLNGIFKVILNVIEDNIIDEHTRNRLIRGIAGGIGSITGTSSNGLLIEADPADRSNS